MLYDATDHGKTDRCDPKSQQLTVDFVGQEISQEELERYGHTLDRFFSILDEWTRRDEP